MIAPTSPDTTNQPSSSSEQAAAETDSFQLAEPIEAEMAAAGAT
jgi:hypothetical protein